MIKQIVDDLAPGGGKHASHPESESFEAVARKYLERLVRGVGNNGEDQLYKTVMDTVERLLLEIVMNHFQYNIIEASRVLGINRNTLSRRLKHFAIKDKVRRGRKKRQR